MATREASPIPPRVILTLLVRDERDIVRANLDYHLARGVDVVVVTDNGSVDGTVSILEEYAATGHVHLIHEPEDTYEQARWVTRMARLAAAEYDADWVINSDADEFWWPASGDLPTTLAGVPSEYGSVVAHRHDFPPVDGPPDEAFHRRMVYRKTRSTSPLGQPLPPKVCHRGTPRISVAQGNHRVASPDLGGRLDDGRLEILHFPLRSYRQFENKIVKGGRAYQRNTSLPSEAGATWRHLYEEWQHDRLREYYREHELDPEGIARGLAEGTLVQDRRLDTWMRQPEEPGSAT